MEMTFTGDEFWIVRACRLLAEFVRQHGDRFDEDQLHHESSFRVAAIAHYFVVEHGSAEQLGDWLEQNNWKDAPAEALEYFRERYFT